MHQSQRLACLTVLWPLALCSCALHPGGKPNPGPFEEIVATSDVDWEQLNPARGDQSPSAGTLWGNRQANVPTGYLIRFKDGFASPPHIHNVSYRGVVIRGKVHNDDPAAARMWMPSGAFWAQPKGEVHITAAQGDGCFAYIEIEAGPYLVLPTVRAFDSGERPVNVDPSNLFWLPAPSASNGGGAEVSWLWGTPNEGRLRGVFLRLPAGFHGTLRATGSTCKAIVIRGRPELVDQNGTARALPPGSYSGTQDPLEQSIRSPGAESILYVRTDGSLRIDAAAGAPR